MASDSLTGRTVAALGGTGPQVRGVSRRYKAHAAIGVTDA